MINSTTNSTNPLVTTYFTIGFILSIMLITLFTIFFFKSFSNYPIKLRSKGTFTQMNQEEVNRKSTNNNKKKMLQLSLSILLLMLAIVVAVLTIVVIVRS